MLKLNNVRVATLLREITMLNEVLKGIDISGNNYMSLELIRDLTEQCKLFAENHADKAHEANVILDKMEG